MRFAGSWFAGYVDVTATPALDFDAPATSAGRDVILAFIVGAGNGSCTPTWGSELTLDQASTSLDLDRRIARLRQLGGRIGVSFGGQSHDELATTCADVAKLAGAYAKVIDRYGTSMIDLDLEGSSLGERAVVRRRAEAIKKVQVDRAASGRPLAIWLTLPVSPQGLTEDGKAAVAEMLRAGVALAGVNVMAMDYGGSRADGQSMQEATAGALTSTQQQLTVLYADAAVSLSGATAWSKLGVTPMIGQNDVPGEVFGLDAAKSLNDFARAHGVGRISMWSLNRDKTCGLNHVDVKRASNACSGVAQGDKRFADLLAVNMAGRLSSP